MDSSVYKAIIENCQNIMSNYLLPDSTISDRDVIHKILDVIDNQNLVELMKRDNEVHDFSWALKMAKFGNAIHRLGWNGKGLKVSVQIPDKNSKMTLPYLYIEYPDGRRCPWLASQTDIMETDWDVIV